MRPFPRSLRQALERRGEGLTVLVVRLAAMGDVLRTLPPVRLVRRALPECRLYWMVDDRWRVLLQDHPDLDGLVEFPRRTWQRWGRSPLGWGRVPGSYKELKQRLGALEVGLVLDFHGNLRSGLAGRLSGAPVRLGYSGHQAREGNRWLNTHFEPSGSRRTPRMERNLDLVRALGLPDHPLPVGGLPLALAGRESAGEIVREALEDQRYGVISPGVSKAQAYKKPPSELLSAAARALEREGLRTLVVWGPGEEEDARRVTAGSEGASTLAPPTDLPTLAALIDGAAIYVGGDSGPLHMACAVGTPVVGVYGPTDPQVNRPWGVPFRCVWPAGRRYTGIKKIDRESGGFEGLEPGQVEAAVGDLLSETRHPTPLTGKRR